MNENPSEESPNERVYRVVDRLMNTLGGLECDTREVDANVIWKATTPELSSLVRNLPFPGDPATDLRCALMMLAVIPRVLPPGRLTPKLQENIGLFLGAILSMARRLRDEVDRGHVPADSYSRFALSAVAGALMSIESDKSVLHCVTSFLAMADMCEPGTPGGLPVSPVLFDRATFLNLAKISSLLGLAATVLWTLTSTADDAALPVAMHVALRDMFGEKSVNDSLKDKTIGQMLFYMVVEKTLGEPTHDNGELVVLDAIWRLFLRLGITCEEDMRDFLTTAGMLQRKEGRCASDIATYVRRHNIPLDVLNHYEAQDDEQGAPVLLAEFRKAIAQLA